MSAWESIKEAPLRELNSFLADFLQRERRRGGSEFCAELAEYQLSTGGKRLRGLVPSFLFKAFERPGFDPLRAIPLGAAVELLHNATLIHDDLQDGDELRRGQPTVWKKYSPAQAINGGDALFQFAQQALEHFECPPEIALRLSRTLSRQTLHVIEGQAQEFLMKDETFPSVERYLQVIRGKTSGLFTLPVTVALHALEQPEWMIPLAERVFGELGLLFQVQDDLLDLYGEKGRGSRASDIREGKISFFAAHVFENGTEADREELKRILRKPREETTDGDITTALEIFERSGAKQAAKDFLWSILKSVNSDAELMSVPPLRMAALSLGEVFLEPVRDFLFS